MDYVLTEYERGIDDYYAGKIPTGWEHSRWDDAELTKVARVPYLSGWYQASLSDNGMI